MKTLEQQLPQNRSIHQQECTLPAQQPALHCAHAPPTWTLTHHSFVPTTYADDLRVLPKFSTQLHMILGLALPRK